MNTNESITKPEDLYPGMSYENNGKRYTLVKLMTPREYAKLMNIQDDDPFWNRVYSWWNRWSDKWLCRDENGKEIAMRTDNEMLESRWHWIGADFTTQELILRYREVEYARFRAQYELEQSYEYSMNVETTLEEIVKLLEGSDPPGSQDTFPSCLDLKALRLVKERLAAV